MKTEKSIKLLAVLVVSLGLVSSAIAAGPDDLLIYYTMDEADSVGGYQRNRAWPLSPLVFDDSRGEETFLAANNGYAPGMFGEAVVLTTDGVPNLDPNEPSWDPSQWEAGNIIDIQAEAESFEPYMKPFENKTISLWFMQTAQRDPALHHPQNDGTEYLLGSYFIYATYIALRPGAEEGDPDVLGFRAGGIECTAGAAGRSDWVTAEIEMNTWYHAAMVLENTAGPVGYNMQASFYLNGVLLARIDGLCRASDAFKWGVLQPWHLAAIGGYQVNETSTGGHCTGALVDDFGIIDVALDSYAINAIYEMGLVGIPLCGLMCPPPPTVYLYHVDGATGSNSNDGLTRETAFETIQKGIDTAQDGDTVLVWPGVYNETATYGINFGNKAITVKSAADAAVLEVPGFPAVTFTNGAGANSVFSNFVVRGSDTGIFVFYADPTINNVTVVDNNNGVIADTANPNITNSIFWNNTNGDLFGSPDPITAQYSLVQDEVDPNLIAYWKLDGDASDSVGTNHGTIYGAQFTSGKIGQGLKFDGSSDYVLMDHAIPDLTMDNHTIALWAMVYSRKSHIFATAGDTDGHYWALTYSEVYDQEFAHWDDEVERKICTSDNDILLNTWIHLAMRRMGTEYAFFVDGIKQQDVKTVGNDFSVEGVPIFGSDLVHPHSLLWGVLDDVHIYDRALSADEIEDMYEAGLAGHSYGSYGKPGFADANNGDYHLLSERGRYRATSDEWLLDDVSSPCIDGGDPSIEPTAERMPNGGSVNMGAYGNTTSASMSEWPLAGDLNLDGIVNFADFAAFAQLWQETLPWMD